MNVAGVTHIGKVRNNNEDAFFINNQKNLIAVADGMGGHKAGEIASGIAIEAMAEFDAMLRDNAAMPVEAFNKAFHHANTRILEHAHRHLECKGMGTTLTAIYLAENIAYIAHVGDSRAYLFSHDQLKQITRDHTLVEELVKNGSIDRESALTHPQKNVLMRAVGVDESVEPDLHEIETHPGDLFIVCSDGLTHYLTDVEIRDILATEENLFDALNVLTERALKRGGGDNITVVGLKVEKKGGEPIG
jgi:protein phosphatase